MTVQLVVGSIVGSSVIAYLVFDSISHRKLLGGTPASDIPSLSPKWKEATELRLLGVEMEGSPEKPILLNPFRRGVNPRIRNKDDFPSLELE